MPNVVPAANRAAAQRSIQNLEQNAHVSKLPMDVWVDGHNLVRRLAFDMNMSVQNMPMPMAMTLQMTIPQYGPQPSPSAPPAGQVTDITSLASRRAAGTGTAGGF